MKGNKHASVCVSCPFYKYNTSNAIYCLPPEDADNFITSFHDSNDRKRYMRKHCYPLSGSIRCHLYEILSQCSEERS